MILGEANRSDHTNEVFLREGLVGRYLDAVKVYKCPGDRSMAEIGGRRFPRVRSVSMNGWLAGSEDSRNRPYQLADKYSDIKRPGPSETFVFLDERADSIDNGYFATMHENVDPLDPATTFWWELPANYHNNSGSFSFADGHAEVHKWTRPMPRMSGSWRADPCPVTPNNTDVMWLLAHSTARK